MSALRVIAIVLVVVGMALCWLIAPVIAAETIDWNVKTVATIQATDEPGAVAEIVFRNDDVNGIQDNGRRELSLGALTVSVDFKWDAVGGADRITVMPPAGFIAIPDQLTVEEDDEGRLLIYPEDAVGM